MSDFTTKPRTLVPRTVVKAKELIANVQQARQQAAAIQARYARPTLFADACPCGDVPAPGLPLCPKCHALLERLHAFATSRTCLSCGDPCAAVLCDACAESGEV